MRATRITTLRLLLMLVMPWVSHATARDVPHTLIAPNSPLAVEIEVGDAASHGPLRFRVRWQGETLIADSPLGIELADGSTLGTDCRVAAVHTNETREHFQQFPGKRSDIKLQGNELILELLEQGANPRAWQVAFRAYDDGVAFQYRIAGTAGQSEIRIKGERTGFHLADGAQLTALPLNGFVSSYESRYVRGPLDALRTGQLYGLPLLGQLPGRAWFALTEAGLDDYAGMYLTPSAAHSGLLESRLSPHSGNADLAVIAKLPLASPWRVILCGETLAPLVESDLVLALNRPSQIEDTSWIRPGMTTFPWWNGYHEEGVTFEPGLNTATMKHYIDFCAEAGIPYHSLDGMGNQAWYGGKIVPYEGADITRGVDGLDLQAVLAHARDKNVRIRVWMHWQAARAHMQRAFPLYHAWGIEGVMIDFMDRDDQEMLSFQHELLELAADHQLTVTLHGVAKPTGLQRTFPHLLNTEGVMNLEYDKWDATGITADHECTIPYTRMLAGPLDFHQGSLRTVPAEAFQPRNEAPWVIGTPCRVLASYVVYQNHLPMIADYPSAYRQHAALPILTSIPCTWEETRWLAGEVGESVVIARRHQDDWWVGGMCGTKATTLEFHCDFLGEGNHQAELYQDDPSLPLSFSLPNVLRRLPLTRESLVRIPCAASGGCLLHIAKTPSN